jgi:hypothetical protein
MTFDIRRTDLDKLNSLTKYPSILTYHTLGDKGALQDAVQVPFAGGVLGAEKVDGTNARLIFGPDGSAIVGSREDLLWERRDLIGNPAMGIVAAGRDVVQGVYERACRPDRIAVTTLRCTAATSAGPPGSTPAKAGWASGYSTRCWWRTTRNCWPGRRGRSPTGGSRAARSTSTPTAWTPRLARDCST